MHHGLALVCSVIKGFTGFDLFMHNIFLITYVFLTHINDNLT